MSYTRKKEKRKQYNLIKGEIFEFFMYSRGLDQMPPDDSKRYWGNTLGNVVRHLLCYEKVFRFSTHSTPETSAHSDAAQKSFSDFLILRMDLLFSALRNMKRLCCHDDKNESKKLFPLCEDLKKGHDVMNESTIT